MQTKSLDRICDKTEYQPARPHSLIQAFIVRLQTQCNTDSFFFMKNEMSTCFLEKKKLRIFKFIYRQESSKHYKMMHPYQGGLHDLMIFSYSFGTYQCAHLWVHSFIAPTARKKNNKEVCKKAILFLPCMTKRTNFIGVLYAQNSPFYTTASLNDHLIALMHIGFKSRYNWIAP